MLVQAEAESVDESDRADVQGCFASWRRTGVLVQALLNDPQEDAQHHVER